MPAYGHLRAVLLILICPFFGSCGTEPPQAARTAPTPTVITDDAGREVTLPAPPERLIPLAPNLTELLFAIGAGSQVAAVSLADDFPPQIENLPRFSSFPVDYEALLALDPDMLIATDAINNPKDASQFSSLGLPVVYFSFNTLGDIPRVMRALGVLANRTASANAAADSLAQRMAAVRRRVADARPERALFLIGADQLYAFGRDNYIHEAIAHAGGVSVTADIDTVSPILSEEFILTARPEVILGTFRSKDQLLENHPALQSVPALQHDRVCLIPPSLVLRPGPRIVAGIEAMARCLHPARFPDRDGERDSTVASTPVGASL